MTADVAVLATKFDVRVSLNISIDQLVSWR
jgi:hypothetical protein